MRLASDGRNAARRIAIAFVLAGLPALGAGCASPPADVALANQRGPTNTGTFPNLNTPPRLATEQFDPKTLEAHVTEMDARRQTQQGENVEALVLRNEAAREQARLRVLNLLTQRVATKTPAQVAATDLRLQRLRDNHGRVTLNAIENQRAAP